jgi:hypothetical protein
MKYTFGGPPLMMSEGQAEWAPAMVKNSSSELWA